MNQVKVILIRNKGAQSKSFKFMHTSLYNYIPLFLIILKVSIISSILFQDISLLSKSLIYIA